MSTEADPLERLKTLYAAVSKKLDGADILVYQGTVNREGYETVSDLCRDPKKASKTLLVVISTLGGDPDAGFRIARCLGSRYEKVIALVPGLCKSAGTLMCIGANELIISDTGELGPLDIQVHKSDELAEMGSGLDLLKTLGHLQQNAYDAFRGFLVDIRLGTQVSTKVAAQMASQLAVGLYGHIFSQIDPVKVGEMNRLMMVANFYGERLDKRSKNLKRGLAEPTRDDVSDARVRHRSEGGEGAVRAGEGAHRSRGGRWHVSDRGRRRACARRDGVPGGRRGHPRHSEPFAPYCTKGR